MDNWWYEVRHNHRGYHLVETDADDITSTVNGMYFETFEELAADIEAMFAAIKKYKEERKDNA